MIPREGLFKLTKTLKYRPYANDDRTDMYDMNVDPRPAYVCVERECKNESAHSHAKRPYLVWRKNG